MIETDCEPVLLIVEGGEYLYTSKYPAGRKGCRYRVLKFVLDVPVYCQKVCVEALTGPDAGLWFVCSPWNFATRYEAAQTEPLPEHPEGR